MKLIKTLLDKGGAKLALPGVQKPFIVAIAAVMSLCASAAVITIPENGTLRLGGTGADPLNQRSNYIVFEPGSTLVITQIGTSATIWATLVATNGAAYLECVNNSYAPSVQLHAFAYGAGSLTLRNMKQPYFGHVDHLPVYRLDNLYSTGIDPLGFANGVSMLKFPSKTNCPWVFGKNNNLVRLCGSDMFPDDNVIEIDSGRSRLMLCNPAAIPAGKTVRVNGDKFLICPLRVPDPEDGIIGCYAPGESATVVSGMVYSCNVELPAGARMTFTNSAPVTFNGSISGYNSSCGNIMISGYKGNAAPVTFGGDNSGFTGRISAGTAGTELVLSNANAAVHATIDMARPMVVRGADGVSSVSVGAVSGGTDQISCIVRAVSNQTISVASVAGYLRISGAGAGSGSVVDIGTLEPGAIVYDDKTAVVTYGGSSAPPSGAARGRTTGEGEFIVMQGDNSCFEAANNVCTAALAFDVTDGTVVTHGTNTVTVRAGAGVEASLAPSAGEIFSVAGEGSFAVESMLRRTVSWWFDFSRADTRFRIGEGSTDAYLNTNYNNSADQPYVERVVDWRYPDAANCLWNRRLYNGGAYDLALGVYPHIRATTQNGLQYISMDASTYSSRRLPFSNGKGYNTVASCEAQLVVMVFGVNTSCHAMFGTAEGAFGRAGVGMTYGMTTNDQHDVWLDGVKVDPTTTKFKDGLQVISVALDGLHFNGLGFWQDIGIDPNRMGGQNYGEVLIFTNAVSDQMRIEAELYLARKWGLDSQYSSTAVAQLRDLRAANPVCIAAAGGEATTIKAGDQAVTVEGPFVGTVELDGGTLVVSNKPLPYTESEIPSAGRLYWADPDDSETVVRIFEDPFYNNSVSSACSNELRTIKDKVGRAFVQGEPVLYAVGDRRPTPIRQSRGLGPVRTWLDFNDYADPTFAGNCLRFVVCPELPRAAFYNGGYTTMATMNVRTAFIVQDSIRGGGGPLLNDVGGIYYPKNRTNGIWTQTIYPDDQPAVLVNGENRLNGNVVDYKNGFLGQPEVFTVRGTDTRNMPYIGCYVNTEGAAKKNGEIIGEVLLYNTALSDADVKGIEAYLMGKWIGRLPDGYADIRNATVAGTGTVQVAVGSQMPRIDRGFEGNVSVADGAFTMTIDPDTDTVMGALDCPAAALSLPASCSITVNFTRKPPKSMETRSYTLVDCASGVDGVDWTFNSGANTTSRCRFVKTGNKVIFRYVRPGTWILFR